MRVVQSVKLNERNASWSSAGCSKSRVLPFQDRCSACSRDRASEEDGSASYSRRRVQRVVDQVVQANIKNAKVRSGSRKPSKTHKGINSPVGHNDDSRKQRETDECIAKVRWEWTNGKALGISDGEKGRAIFWCSAAGLFRSKKRTFSPSIVLHGETRVYGFFFLRPCWCQLSFLLAPNHVFAFFRPASAAFERQQVPGPREIAPRRGAVPRSSAPTSRAFLFSTATEAWS
jgi:hypothetical protein